MTEKTQTTETTETTTEQAATVRPLTNVSVTADKPKVTETTTTETTTETKDDSK